MALGAMSADPSLKVKIVPGQSRLRLLPFLPSNPDPFISSCSFLRLSVGLSYFHPHKFRSRAVVEFGAPMDVPPELVEEFGKGGKEKREACQKLLDLIYDGLKTVTIRTPDWETLMVSLRSVSFDSSRRVLIELTTLLFSTPVLSSLSSLSFFSFFFSPQVIQAGRRLYKAPGQYLTLGQTVELNKRFIEGYLHYQDEPRVIALREHIIKYNRKLRDLGLRDHQVERATRAGWRSLGLLFYRLVLLLAWSILALPGVILRESSHLGCLGGTDGRGRGLRTLRRVELTPWSPLFLSSDAPIFIPAKIWSHKKAKGESSRVLFDASSSN